MRTNVVTVATAFLMLCFGMTQSSGDLQDANKVDTLWQHVITLEGKLNTLEGKLNTLKQKLDDTTANANSIKNTLSSIRTEEGIVNCGSSNEFLLNTSEFPQNRVKYVRVNFSQAFNRVPEVTGSIQAVDADKNINLRYKVMVGSIDTKGFTVICMTWANTILYGIDYQWRATTPLKV